MLQAEKVRAGFSSPNENNKWPMTPADPAGRGPSCVQNSKSRGFFQNRFLLLTEDRILITIIIESVVPLGT